MNNTQCEFLLLKNDMKLVANIHRAKPPLQILIVDSHTTIGIIKDTRQNTLNNKTIMIILLLSYMEICMPHLFDMGD